MTSVSRLHRMDDLAPVEGRAGVIDIGSNSIRLVVYAGTARIPIILFNEKVMAGLGRGLARDGALDAASIERALAALDRFQLLARQMRVATLLTVATAAVRDASNGPEFLARLQARGLAVELLSGADEAILAGQGVLAAIPGACGIVGDMGGGSLELVRVGDGQVHETASLPLGVLRAAPIKAKGSRALERAIVKALDKAGWGAVDPGQPFYMVGGSWRALARLDMYLNRFPLPIVHHYRMPAGEASRLVRILAHAEPKRLRAIPDLPSARVPMLPVAAAVLAVLVRQMRPSELIVSAYGLREGLLHRDLAPAMRAEDPLLCSAREEGALQGRFPEHGDLLNRWIAPLFSSEGPQDARLRHAACLLSDVGWRTHPEFRAERGLETALHGNWVGIDARERAMLGRALFTSFGGTGPLAIVTELCSPAEQARADRWGLAIRLGQRLSGGVARALQESRVALAPDTLSLTLTPENAALYGETVERRHKALAAAFGLKPVMLTG